MSAITAGQNNYGLYPHEWKNVSWSSKVRLWLLKHFLMKGEKCEFLRELAKLYAGQCIGIHEFKCECSLQDGRSSREKCWCTCTSDRSLKMGKGNITLLDFSTSER